MRLLYLPERLAQREPSTKETLLWGLGAGFAGTLAMTAWQETWSRLKSRLEEESTSSSSQGSGDEKSQDPWQSAPAPAKVVKMGTEATAGYTPPPQAIPYLNQAVHWGYGVAWGPLYALAQTRLKLHPAGHGVAFGTLVWLSSYAELVPLGLYEPPWKYGPKTLLPDWSYHLAYGLGVAYGYQAIERHRRQRR